MYFSSIFPYVVLLCFLVRGLLLDGAREGIVHMFYPKVRGERGAREGGRGERERGRGERGREGRERDPDPNPEP